MKSYAIAACLGWFNVAMLEWGVTTPSLGGFFPWAATIIAAACLLVVVFPRML